jgi:hypothetical protein
MLCRGSEPATTTPRDTPMLSQPQFSNATAKHARVNTLCQQSKTNWKWPQMASVVAVLVPPREMSVTDSERCWTGRVIP